MSPVLRHYRHGRAIRVVRVVTCRVAGKCFAQRNAARQLRFRAPPRGFPDATVDPPTAPGIECRQAPPDRRAGAPSAVRACRALLPVSPPAARLFPAAGPATPLEKPPPMKYR